jgi:Fur family transcriptional regulator, ferric uptake regulator
MQSSIILESLKNRGHKNTKVRQALIEILLLNNTPLSNTDLLQELSKRNLSPNKTTVYREIEFLKDQKILEEVDFGDGKKRFEISENHHHHIICISCQKIQDIPMEKDLNEKERQIMRKFDFKPIGHSLEFFGLCKDCQKT